MKLDQVKEYMQLTCLGELLEEKVMTEVGLRIVQARLVGFVGEGVVELLGGHLPQARIRTIYARMCRRLRKYVEDRLAEYPTLRANYEGRIEYDFPGPYSMAWVGETWWLLRPQGVPRPNPLEETMWQSGAERMRKLGVPSHSHYEHWLVLEHLRSES